MVFKSDAQRKGFFGARGFVKSQLKPFITNNPTRRRKPRLSLKQREFIAKEIRRGIKEGRPQQQSIAIAFSKARKKFKDKRFLPRMTSHKGNPNGIFPKRTRNLLITLLGVAIALRLFRQLRSQ